MICVRINTNPLFQKISAVIVSEVDNVSKFALVTTAILEHDFKSEYSLPICWRHLKLIPICAIMLCRF